MCKMSQAASIKKPAGNPAKYLEPLYKERPLVALSRPVMHRSDELKFVA